MHPWRFPGILLYCWHGGLHLFRLLRQGENYHLLLPQDGIVSAAFAGLLGRLAGIRVVCMDSGSLLWSDQQKRNALFYRFSLRLLAAIAARCCDQFLLASDEVAEIYRVHLKVRPDRIMRSVLLVDVARFAGAEKGKKLRLRLGCGFAPDTILIALAHRPLLEGEVGIALEGIVLALNTLPPAIRARVRVLIAEEKETQVRQAILRYRLQDICCLWGNASAEEMEKLLNMADIFLSVGTRRADDMITVLEAMAASCAVVATRTSRTHAQLLTEGRGISVLPDSATEIGIALADLCKDPDLCRHMGCKAREYVACHHSIQMLQRSLLRSSFFAPMHSN